MELNPGDEVNGRYQINEQIGRGAFSTVFSAYDIESEQEVALKVFTPSSDSRFGTLEQQQKRFEAEAQLVQRLRHPHVVRVFEWASTDESSYIVMPYIPNSLSKLMAQSGSLTLEQAMPIICQLCDSVAYLHKDRRVIHCDLKPGNVLLDGERGVVLIDFGIAYEMSSKESGQRDLALSTYKFGTTYYLSPEQIHQHEPDPRMDVYALGALFFHMLTGHHYLKFKYNIPDETTEDVRRENSEYNKKLILNRSDRELPNKNLLRTVPEPFSWIIEKALAKLPEARFEHAGEMLEALKAPGFSYATQLYRQWDSLAFDGHIGLVERLLELYEAEERPTSHFSSLVAQAIEGLAHEGHYWLRGHSHPGEAEDTGSKLWETLKIVTRFQELAAGLSFPDQGKRMDEAFFQLEQDLVRHCAKGISARTVEPTVPQIARVRLFIEEYRPELLLLSYSELLEALRTNHIPKRRGGPSDAARQAQNPFVRWLTRLRDFMPASVVLLLAYSLLAAGVVSLSHLAFVY